MRIKLIRIRAVRATHVSSRGDKLEMDGGVRVALRGAEFVDACVVRSLFGYIQQPALSQDL